ncbi:MAG: prolyl aminopeptidase [Alphaproteobacteria bacterium]|nr:prolyl aminopeptidase [Alphaproteobacteria bacterium]
MDFSERIDLYPPTEPYRHGHLDVGDGHEIYYEECGNPRGIPALLLHGGPGAGSSRTMRRFHDPRRYRIILYDQRGCGHSRPNASLTANTTWHLVADIERLRTHLGISSWQVFGGSWGSTLALAYAQSYPDKVTGLILRGVFLVRNSEVDWFYNGGCGWLFPDHYRPFLDHIPVSERGDIIAAYYRRLTSPDQSVQLAAARVWSAWEGSTLSMYPERLQMRSLTSDHYVLAFARIECHYFVHGGFLSRDAQLLEDAHRLNGIPGVVVAGRYDVITPVKSAWELCRQWHSAELRIVPDAGHAMTEPGTLHELVAATQRFAGQQS